MLHAKSFAAALGVAAILSSGAALAGDPESCKAVRLSDVGWTDIQATTGVASVILTALGYEPDVKVLSVPVTYASLKNKDIDVFLGNWMPSMTADVKPYTDDKSVETICQEPRRRRLRHRRAALCRRRRRQDADRPRQVQGQVRRQDLRHRGRQ